MARITEFIKKSEARILIFLRHAAPYMKNGKLMSKKLEIDYIYLMKLLRGMYDKGWVGTHLYNNVYYFKTTRHTPIKEAIARVSETQRTLK
jgi:hypothetical protein